MGVGGARARALVSYCGSVRQVFELKNRELAQIPGIGKQIVQNLNRQQAIRDAELEYEWVQKRDLDILFYTDPRFPSRLKHCEDAPVLLYGEGDMNLNQPTVVSIVGTRNHTSYGLGITEHLVAGLKDYGALVVSGLAYGIDTIAHRCAVQEGLQTVGVLGHSLDRIYPASNERLVQDMQRNGGVLSEFDCGTKPYRENFPQRNRIVAGMADVTVVVETMVKGGSMITARMAASYNRDVVAFPGVIDAPFSSGCNHLIKTNQAALIESVDDLAYLMGWEKCSEKKGMSVNQKQLFLELEGLEKEIYDHLSTKKKETLDDLSLSVGVPVSKATSALLGLEFKGVIRSLPGKVYEIA